MATILNNPASWANEATVKNNAVQTESKLTTFINSQKKYVTAWFLISLMVQGVFFLPIPAVLIFSFNAPAYILVFTLGLFFANIIAGMSNAGVKTIIALFASSVIVHALLVAIFTI
jgi:hypothetical protein